MMLGNWRHDAADAFDDDAFGGRCRPAREGDDGVEIDALSFGRRRHVRRERGAIPEGRNAVEIGLRYRLAERSQQGARIAGLRLRRIEAAGQRLERRDGAAAAAEFGNEPAGDEGLADVGAGTGDENRAHASTRSRIKAASRSMSASAWPAVKANRNRAVPSGTVGGRMATARKPSSSSRRDAASACSALPKITGTMALCASGKPAA